MNNNKIRIASVVEKKTTDRTQCLFVGFKFLRQKFFTPKYILFKNQVILKQGTRVDKNAYHTVAYYGKNAYHTIPFNSIE